jgi:hypothetical protein
VNPSSRPHHPARRRTSAHARTTNPHQNIHP